MPFSVFSLVLLAAVFHATWNVIVKGGGNKLFEAAFNTLGGGLGALCLLPVVGLPPRGCWLLLGLSVCFHLLYSISMASAYRVAALTIAYPVMRGAAPLITALALALIGAALPFYGWIGIVLLCAGILALAFQQKQTGSVEGILLALRTSLAISAYTLADGFGAREAGNSLVYTAWLFVFNLVPLNAYCLIKQRKEFIIYSRKRLGIGIGGGLCGLASYGIAIWAMTVAPIALVAALRETSVIFGMILALIFLREKLTSMRVIAILLVAGGAVLVRLG